MANLTGKKGLFGSNNHPNRSKKRFSVTVAWEGPCKYVVRTNGEIHSICGDEHTAREDAGRQYAANLKISTRNPKAS